MGAISFNNKLYPVGGTPAANMSVYDNSDSGLDATNVQDAIDELAEGGGGGGGHTIIDDTGTAVAQRSKLQFGDYDLTDDSENDITKVDLVKPEEVTWANYQQLTPAQKAGKQFYVPDYPSIGGVFFFQTEAAMQAAEATLPDNAVCIVWEDDPYVVTADDVEYDNTDSGLTADNIQDAVDEVVTALDGKQDALTNPLTQSDVVNNLTSDATNVPLSAAMGKALNDELGDFVLQPDDGLVLANFTFTATSDVGGWIKISTPKGVILSVSNCAGLWPSPMNTTTITYTCFQRVMVNSISDWRVLITDHNNNIRANTQVTGRVLAYVLKSIL